MRIIDRFRRQGSRPFKFDSAVSVSARSFSAAIVIFGFLFGGLSQANDVTLPVTADTFTAPSGPDTNYNGLKYVRVRDSGDKVGFLNFDLSALNSLTINSAILNVRVKAIRTPGDIEVFGVLESWDEASVTHNTRPAFSTSPITTIPVTTTDLGTYIQLDIVSTVQQWANQSATAFGIVLRGSNGLDVNLSTQEDGNAAFIDVAQGEPAGNVAPSIISTPPTLAVVTETYTYDVEATDPNSADTLTFDLDLAPPAMTIDGVSGLIEWTPLSGDEGIHAVVVNVSDNGQPVQSQTQSFDIVVNAPGASGPSLLYFSTLGNTPVSGVPGPYDDGDIYRFNTMTGQLDRVFDARNAGLKGHADIDALHVVDSVTFYMSFGRNTGTVVPDIGTVMDSDIVLYHAGKFSWFLRGTDVGLGDDGNGEDIDALSILSDNSILISTAGTPKVNGVSGARNTDVLRCVGTFGATSSCTWNMFLDGSTVGLSGKNENVNALFALDGDLNFSTRGPLSVSGLSADKADVSSCEGTGGTGPISCASFYGFFDGSQYGLTDDLDAADLVPNSFVDPNPGQFRVVVMGSSTAGGSGASSAASSWVGLLDTWLGTATASHEIINLSKSGFTTETYRPDGSSPLPDVNRNITRMLEINPDLIIINLPSNNVGAGIPVGTTIAHYQQIKAAADNRGVPLVITTTQPRNFDDPALRVLLQDEATAVLAQFGSNAIDIYSGLVDSSNLGLKPAYDSGDGTHPNNAGHNLIFQAVRAQVTQYVTP
jgi:lysophospholipase L1-like esterase